MRSEPKMWDQEPPPRDRYRGPSANTRGDKTTYGNKSVKNTNRTADPQTISLNRTLRAALRTARAAAGGLEQIPDLLETTAAPFNHLTVKYALRLTRKMSDKTPRAKLAFAVRVVQRARRDNARLDSYSLLHTLALAKPFRKVNLIRALKRVVEQHHMEQEHQQNNRRHSQAALLMETYFRLVSHWALCGRPALRDASVLEMMRAYQTQDADVFERLLSYLIYRQQTDAAVAIWKLMGAPALPAGQPIDVGLLNAGTLLCSVTHDAAQAQRIVRKYKEMCFTPKTDVFFVLMSIFIKAKRLDRARKLMRWMSGLVGYKYVLHERELHEYVRICLESGTEAEDLLPLADLLVCTERLCGNAVDRLGFFRAYFKALQSGVSEGRLSSRVREVADCAGACLSIGKSRTM
ncbi:hypothetical protein FVE85_4346 [Porphyridium purpureum]|uniref:Uncharacterized protein n=1 Tax=Porphyridium purpureum TaxID=35688 RepID=A0A5J4YHU4_PORPP|nr:hypothetical protein FVE85_4346 [Porphyridium purpureum]|eukprot:POR4168..scf270_19